MDDETIINKASSQPIQPGEPDLKRILVVEDEFFISELYARALRKAGYEVTVSPDGKQALEQAKTNLYDIILLDLMLPSITGIDILNIMKDPNLTPKLRSKIIVTTNLEQSEKDRKAIESKADGYIVKADLTPKELVNFLHKLEA